MSDEEKIVDLGKRRTRTRPRPMPTEILTEDSVALKFRDNFAGQIVFDHEAGTWFKCEDGLWRPERTGIALNWSRETTRILATGADVRTRKSTERSAFALGVERFARADRAFAVTSEIWDRDQLLLGTPGGVVDLRTGELRDADPADYITKRTSVTPAGAARCPLWVRFLEDATGGDPALVNYLQILCGYALTGLTREHALFFVYGPGGNGKSVFLSTISRIVGSYAVTAPMDTFTASSGDRHPTDLAMLKGARLVTASETEQGRAWAESKIKSLTGGDPITARYMRQDFFTFQPAFKLLIVGNYKPILHGVDEAMRRRLHIIPFVHRPTNPDRELEAKLMAEAPGILRWMIDGCLAWQREGLQKPPVVRRETESYFSAQDVFQQWLEENCDVDPDFRETSGSLFADWKVYATNGGERPGNRNQFAENMVRRGFQQSRAHGGMRMFQGLRLRQTGTNAEGFR